MGSLSDWLILPKTKVQLPPKPIQRVIPNGIRAICENCGLVEDDDLPRFHNHHIIPNSVTPWHVFIQLGEEKHRVKTLCPWCHAEEHDKIVDILGATGVANWLKAWSSGKFNGKEQSTSPE